MTGKSTFLDPAVQEYVISTMVREHPLQIALREETSRAAHSRMAIGPEQGQFMGVLARAIGARRYLEIGVFTGYSSLAMALAMPEDAYVLACDVNAETTAVARRYWEAAGVAGRIDLRIAPALETLDRVIAEGIEPFDIAFIDADKHNVGEYFERCLSLVRIGGFILVDNVLWDGAVTNPAVDDPDTRALRAVAAKAAADERVSASLVPICDGLLVALRVR